MSGLTKRQFEALSFIRSFIAEHGYSPRYTEIGAALGLAHVSGVHRIVHGLAERGAIDMIPEKARSISLPQAVSR